MGELVGPQLCIAIIFVVICAHVAYTAVDLFDSYFRLPPHFIPIVYDLKLSLSSKKESICGQVRIEMQCIQSTSEVLLHANPLFVKVQHAIIENRLTNETVDLGMPAVDWNRYLVAFNSSIVFDHAAVYYLSIWFQTTYADSHGGLIKYEDKERGVWASTLFEPTNARRLFPCFDEPRWRSIFKLQLWLEDDFASARYVALSNTAGTYKHWNERLTIWGFDPTPPIPTYLLAITLGQFVYGLSTLLPFLTSFAYTRNAKQTTDMSMADYLLSDTGARLHLLFIPIAINGMENFGLISIKESLWPSGEADKSDASWVSFKSTLFHELVHQ
ncbi:unnamed protein product [Toxocara canis]|uniref:Peptidase_M1_N domain-containing protein n=1 Tax=Toxocara canis TaxID=6265 RepID=A0A183UPQ2_TOXCA|nr:unnamed protein product [Toxocara canis]